MQFINFKNISELTKQLEEIESTQEGYKRAQYFLTLEVTSFNIQEVQKFLDNHNRNR